MNRIHVAVCFDDTMAMPAAVVAASVAARTRDSHVTFYMLHPPGLSVDIAALKRKLNSKRFVIEECLVTADISDLYSTTQYSAAMYYRFLLPHFVQADRVIYLDCDTMVRRSLTELYATDLKGRPVGAAEDHGLTYHMRDHGMPFHYKDGLIDIEEYCTTVLNFDLRTTPYFNNGVLVMDLDMWRRTKLAERCFAFCRDNPGLGMADQDGANAILQGNFTPIDDRWNSFSYLYREYFPTRHRKLPEIFGGYEKHFRTPTGRWHDILSAWAFDPWIVHFSFQSKPWVAHHRRTDYDIEFWRNAFRTPFGGKLLRPFLAARRKALPDEIASEFHAHPEVRRTKQRIRRAKARMRLLRGNLVASRRRLGERLPFIRSGIRWAVRRIYRLPGGSEGDRPIR